MKTKFMSFLILAISLMSCAKNELIEEDLSYKKETDANTECINRRSYAEALEIAQKSIVILKSNDYSTRSKGSDRLLDLKKGVKVIRTKSTRSAENGNDTLIYVFNFKDNQGFAIVSASRQTTGLIAITESGYYDPDSTSDNVAFETYMMMAKEYVLLKDKEDLPEIHTETRSSSDEFRMYKPVYDTVHYYKIEPKLSTRWGQTGFIAQYCPNGVTGCANTALAQIMTYYKYPTSLKLTYSGKDVNETSLDWDAICGYQYTYWSSTGVETEKQIGRLARQLGKLSGSTYKADTIGTETRLKNSRSAISSLGYNVGSITDYAYVSYDSMYPLAVALGSNKLIFMQGYNSDESGHGWVIDGCLYVKVLHRLMCTYDGENWFVDQELGTCTTCHNHINWGWNGDYNGYFDSTILCAFLGLQYDNGVYHSKEDNKNYSFYNNLQYYTIWY